MTTFGYDRSRTPRALRAALRLVAEDFPVAADGCGMPVEFRLAGDGPAFEFAHGRAVVSGKTIPQALRALAALRGFAETGRIPARHAERPRFDTLGLSLDCSRGAVSTVATVRMFLRRMALMGLNTLALYTEDTYEVPGEPYFGYLRGRFTQAELRGLDDCAHALGIEMFPCIQTLAHLFQMLRWRVYGGVADMYDILLAGEPKTYELIGKMLRAASAPYRSRRIHLGMDEAGEAGLHEYRRRHGLRPRMDVMLEHLRRVAAIAKRLGLRPMIWGDMLHPDHRQGPPKDVYLRRPKDLARRLPKNVQIVYWDYYRNEKDHYRRTIDAYRAMGKEPIFAPGLWTWHFFWQNFEKVRVACGAGMSAAKEKGVREAIITCWGDDGSEADFVSILPGLQYFAECGYADEVTDAALARQFRGSCGSDVKAWITGGAIDRIPGVVRERSGLHPANPSKFLLWQDPLAGILEEHLKGIRLAEHYRGVAKRLRKLARGKTETAFHLRLPLALAEVLEDKAEFGLRLIEAYARGDRRTLAKARDAVLPRMLRRLRRLHETHRAIWFANYKPNGWEVLDNRYSALEGRLRSARRRLDDYLRGRIASLPELEEKRLPCLGWPKGTLSDAALPWRYLVSASVVP